MTTQVLSDVPANHHGPRSDTDQKQGIAMNHNPNYGNSHKEEQMNAITKSTSVAVLVALSLALAAQAAEPSKSEPAPDP